MNMTCRDLKPNQNDAQVISNDDSEDKPKRTAAEILERLELLAENIEKYSES
jgi:hypothetical protein